ncbi:MAG: nucleotidyl transferase AbiEii/AbiGii toxin family protein [Patescibacteria group bacterium]
MDVASRKQVNSNLGILPLETKKAFVFLSGQPWLSKSGWYLAGGTALALQAGHRKSIDLDFFTAEKDFDNSELLNNFLGNSGWKTVLNRKNAIYGELLKAKVSFIAYPFFIPKRGFIQYGSIKILHPIDIAVMKIIAISQWGRKRDFFDLYWCAKNIELLENSIKRLKIQYPSVAHDHHHILKSLVYFNDAEADPSPEVFFKAAWKDVKNYFKKEVIDITNKLIIQSG